MTENEAFSHAVTLAAAFVANGDLRIGHGSRHTVGVPSDQLRELIQQLHQDVLMAHRMCEHQPPAGEVPLG